MALRWGLIPSWSKGPDNRYATINARAESVAGKPSYRGPLRNRRCLVLGQREADQLECLAATAYADGMIHAGLPELSSAYPRPAWTFHHQ